MLLAILMFTSTSTASFLFSKGKLYERLPENSPFKAMLDRLYQVAYNNDDDVALDTDEEDDETDDEEDDDEYDDGMTDLDDGPEENLLLPKIWNMVGEITPDGGNEPVDEIDDLEETSNTIDSPQDGDEDGTIWDDEWMIDSNGAEGIMTNEKTIDEDEGAASNGGTTTVDEGGWTVDEGEWTVKRDRFVEIVKKCSPRLGALVEWVIERDDFSDENGFFSESTWISGEDTKAADGIVGGDVVVKTYSDSDTHDNVIDD